MTLVESRRPRAAFLQLVVDRLGLANTSVATRPGGDAHGARSTSASPGRSPASPRLGCRRPAPAPRREAGLLRRRTVRSGGIAPRRRIQPGDDVGACKVGAARYHEPAVTTSGAKAAPLTTSSRSTPTGDAAPPSGASQGHEEDPVPPERPGRGPHHRDREPEGRRRQVHDRGEPRRRAGRARLPGPGGRPRPAGQRLDGHGDPPRGAGDRPSTTSSSPTPRSTRPSCRPRSSTCSRVPSTIDLAGAEIELVSQFSRETRLKKAARADPRGSATTSSSSTARRRSAC